jgi:hypothetical protein
VPLRQRSKQDDYHDSLCDLAQVCKSNKWSFVVVMKALVDEWLKNPKPPSDE